MFSFVRRKLQGACLSLDVLAQRDRIHLLFSLVASHFFAFSLYHHPIIIPLIPPSNNQQLLDSTVSELLQILRIPRNPSSVLTRIPENIYVPILASFSRNPDSRRGNHSETFRSWGPNRERNLEAQC